jgi:hypothetical protein
MAPTEAVQVMMKNMTEESQKKDMAGWTQWMKKYEANFADPGAPAGKNTRVTKDGVQEVSNDVMGYSIMKADSKDQVIQMLQESSHINMPGSYTEVMECKEMPSM